MLVTSNNQVLFFERKQSSTDAPIVIQLSLLFVTIAKLQVQGNQITCTITLYIIGTYNQTVFNYIFSLFGSTES
jgi:hypothetical protein